MLQLLNVLPFTDRYQNSNFVHFKPSCELLRSLKYSIGIVYHRACWGQEFSPRKWWVMTPCILRRQLPQYELLHMPQRIWFKPPVRPFHWPHVGHCTSPIRRRATMLPRPSFPCLLCGAPRPAWNWANRFAWSPNSPRSLSSSSSTKPFACWSRCCKTIRCTSAVSKVVHWLVLKCEYGSVGSIRVPHR